MNASVVPGSKKADLCIICVSYLHTLITVRFCLSVTVPFLRLISDVLSVFHLGEDVF